MTNEEVKGQFLAKLQALFDEYGAELEISDVFHNGYVVAKMFITIPAIYSETDTIRPWTEIELGTYFGAIK